MRTLLAAFALLVMVAAATTATATEYFGIDQFMGGDVTLALDYVDPYFIDTETYHVHRFDWSVTNNGPNTYEGVKMVLPFHWLTVDGGLQAYDYDNANGEWHWTDTTDDFYLTTDQSAYTPAPADLLYMLMSDTDLPLSYNWAGQVASVLSTDSVPTWVVTSSLGPGETATFTMYLEQETDSRVSGVWDQPYVVAAVPEPATLLIAGLGAAGVFLARRKR